MSKTRTAQQIAEDCGRAMYARDRASQALGIKIAAISPGSAIAEMTVREDMLNGHDTCLGGIIFSLADCAFAFACNAYNEIAVAAACDIQFLKPGRLADKLMATATETYRDSRNGIYDVIVADQAGQTIAAFRGKSRIVGGAVIRESE